MTRRIGNNAKTGFITDDHDLRETIAKVRRREILYLSTKSLKRQPVNEARSSNFKDIDELNKNAIKLVFKVLSSKPTLFAISKLQFLVGIEYRKSGVKSVMP